jgi:hypothetical protein
MLHVGNRPDDLTAADVRVGLTLAQFNVRLGACQAREIPFVVGTLRNRTEPP